MYKFYLKSNTAQEINIICIAVVTLTSDSELVLNKRRASKWSVIRVVFMPRVISLFARKGSLRLQIILRLQSIALRIWQG